MRYGSGGVQFNTLDDFWNKVEIREPDECWNWRMGTWWNGYGRFKWHYQSWRAHRFALVSIGRIPADYQGIVRHLCHNKKCCNPKHLAWGTQQENVDDRERRKQGISCLARQEVSVEEYEAGLPCPSPAEPS